MTKVLNQAAKFVVWHAIPIAIVIAPTVLIVSAWIQPSSDVVESSVIAGAAMVIVIVGAVFWIGLMCWSETDRLVADATAAVSSCFLTGAVTFTVERGLVNGLAFSVLSAAVFAAIAAVVAMVTAVGYILSGDEEGKPHFVSLWQEHVEKGKKGVLSG